MKVLITGPSGAGKTYLSKELKKLGLNSVDADLIEGLSSWYDGRGNVVKYPENAGKEFLDNHSFLWNKSFLEDYLADKNDIYLLGSSGNIFEMLDLFDKSYYLDVSGEAIGERLQHEGRENPMGNTEYQRNNAILWAQELREKAKSLGLNFINGELSAEEIFKLLRA